MATNPTNTPSPAGASLLDVLTANRERLGIGLLALGAGFAAIPITFIVRQGWAAMEITIWGTFLSLASFAAGAVCLTARSRMNLTETEQVRLVLLVLGGVMGFATALLGLILPVSRYASVFGGGLQTWSKNPWTVWGCGAAVLGGLGLMFLSLFLARGQERTNPLMRRLMYGYNAFFSSFLLLAVLVLINVLGYSPLPVFGAFQKTYDWTANQVYTLQPATKKQLQALAKPVHVILLMSENSELRPDMVTLLNNCREAAPNFSWEQHSPELLRDEERQAYQEQFAVPEDMAGMIVIYGQKPDIVFTFVRESELAEAAMPAFEERQPAKKFTFKGEAALSTALDYLESGKAKAVLYFTQGNGELAISRETPVRPQDSMAFLMRGLAQYNYVTRPLRLDAATKEIPADASVVVIARPLAPLPEAAVAALRTYLQGGNGKHGKVIALLNGVAPSGTPVSDPRLEELLGEYNVVLGHDRIVRVDDNGFDPTQFEAAPDAAGGNPIAEVFAQVGMHFFFSNAQTLEVQTTHPESHAVPFLQTWPTSDGGPYVLSQKDFREDPANLVRDTNKAIEDRKIDASKGRSYTVAAAVSESGAPRLPAGHPAVPGPEQPVMAVFGDASWLSDQTLAGHGSQFASIHFSLFKSTVDWLREKATIGEQVKSLKGAEREEFSLTKVSEPASWAVEIMPGLVMLCGILALGLGVALVRRR